jgi:hypothetical protein
MVAASNCPTAAKWPARERGFGEFYQPLGRFWSFQLIESGIFVGLSLAVLAVAAWWILCRTA